MTQDITRFTDYREFLRIRFEELKAEKGQLSFQFAAKRLGTAKSYLKLIFEKQRHISLEKVNLIAQFFQLTAFEKQFLTYQFLKQSVKDAELVEYFESVLAAMRSRKRFAHTPANAGVSTMSAENKSAVYGSWLRMAIQAMNHLPDFRADAAWITARLAGGDAKQADVQKVVDDFLARGLIGDGTARDLPFGEPAPEDLDHFQQFKVGVTRTAQVLDAPQKFVPNQFYMMCIALNEEDCHEVKRLFLTLRDQIREIARKSVDPTEVHFISNNLFAVTDRDQVATTR